jgi:hypothetical protein
MTMEPQQMGTRLMTRAGTKTTAVVDKPLASANSANTRTQSWRLALKQRLQNLTNNCLPFLAQILAAINSEHDNFELHNNIELANDIFDPKTGQSLTYRKLIKHPEYKDVWKRSAANEFGRLAQGILGNCISGTNTIKFVNKAIIPVDRWQDITYVKFVCEYKPNKEEKERTRLAVGGDRVNYPDEVGTPTADLLLIKTHLNSVILMPAARYMTMDISNFYLNTPMERFEYAHIPIVDIPEEIISEYDLAKLLDRDNCVYIEIQKGMYGLLQAGILAQELLEQRMARHGYNQSKIVPGLWTHNTCPNHFHLGSG